MRRFLFLVFFSFLSPQLWASEEVYIGLKNFRVEAPGVEYDGPVIVIGTQKRNVFDSFKIDVFGREFVLDEQQLSKLKSGFLSGVTVSFEEGYKETGGRAYYITLSVLGAGKKSLQKISIHKNGEVNVYDARPDL